MKIASISDVHGMWNKIEHFPPADVLVCAGDLLANAGFGYFTKDEEAAYQLTELKAFHDFLKAFKDSGHYKEVVVVAGNHDWVFERRNADARAILTDVIYLQDDSAVIDGVKFHGSPWQRWFWDWAFNLPNHDENFYRYRAHATKIYDLIEDDVNVLVTHGPPHEVGVQPSSGLLGLDYVPRGMNVGDPIMAKRCDKLEHLKAHIFGHIHCGYGQFTDFKGCQNVNTAICNEAYEPDNPVPVIEIEV